MNRVCEIKSPRTGRTILALVTAAVGLIVATSAPGQTSADAQTGPGQTEPDSRGWSVTGRITDRDNTRVAGIVYDPQGNPLPKVEIWVTNHDAPGVRVRLRTKPIGSYLARNLARLYTVDDVFGITLRLSFERDGYQPFEVLAGVARNGLVEIHPILWPDGDSPTTTGWCVVVKGKVSSADGKGIKKAAVTITSPIDPAFRVETTVAKNGSYQALIWNAPATLTVTATAPGSGKTGK